MLRYLNLCYCYGLLTRWSVLLYFSLLSKECFPGENGQRILFWPRPRTHTAE